MNKIVESITSTTTAQHAGSYTTHFLQQHENHENVILTKRTCNDLREIKQVTAYKILEK